MTLKKKELAGIYAEKFDLGKGKAEQELDAFFGFLEEVLVEYQEGFQMGNLGKLEVGMTTARTARKGRNPQTGEEIDIAAVPPHLGFKFKQSKGATSVREQLKKA